MEQMNLSAWTLNHKTMCQNVIFNFWVIAIGNIQHRKIMHPSMNLRSPKLIDSGKIHQRIHQANCSRFTIRSTRFGRWSMIIFLLTTVPSSAFVFSMLQSASLSIHLLTNCCSSPFPLSMSVRCKIKPGA